MNSNKILYLDNLRALIIVFMVIGHAAHAFKLDGGQFCTFPDQSSLSFFNVISELGMSIRMPMLFMISGFFMAMSLSKKTAWTAFKDRTFRLATPFLFGLLFITPLVSFLQKYFSTTNHHALPAWDHYFWREFIDGNLIHHLWFMPFLLILNSLTILTYQLPTLQFRQKLRTMSQQTPIILFIFAAFILCYVITLYCTHGRFHFFTLLPILKFFAMPAMSNLTGYCLGLLAFENKWLNTLPNRCHPLMFMLPISIYLLHYVLWSFSYYHNGLNHPWMPIFYALVHLISCWGLVFFLLAFTKHHMNKALGIFGVIRKHSYAIFFGHFPIIVALQVLSPHIALPHIIKFFLMIGITLLLSLIVSLSLLQRIPILSQALYGKGRSNLKITRSQPLSTQA